MSPGRANYDDRLADYVDVKERIKLFYEAHPEGRLTTTDVRITSEPDDTPRVWVENTETSAWGRAIGSLGIGIDKGIASANEVRAKAGETTRPAQEREQTDDGGLIGVAEKGKGQADYELRETPHGPALSFRLVQGRKGMKVVAKGALATALKAQEADVLGQRVTCWGAVDYETFRPKDSDKDVTYPVMTLNRIQAPEFTLPAEPAPSGLSAEDEAELDAIADRIPVAPGQVGAGLG